MHLPTKRLLVSLLCHTVFLRGTQGKDRTSGKYSLNEGVDPHLVFKQPLTEGVYNFTKDGFIPLEPIVRIRKIHKEMIHTIQVIDDHAKQVRYLLTLCNTANDDLSKIRQKLETSGITNSVELDKKNLKADVFILLISHTALVGNAVLYFPDIMSIILKKNPEFESNFRWIVEFTSRGNIISDQALLKLFHLVKQELGIIPKDPDYQNPYKTAKVMLQSSTTTKKPRKKLQRGPRLSGSEL